MLITKITYLIFLSIVNVSVQSGERQVAFFQEGEHQLKTQTISSPELSSTVCLSPALLSTEVSIKNPSITIGFLQFCPGLNIQDNIQYILNALSNTKDSLITLPEFFLTSYDNSHFFSMHSLESELEKILDLSEKNELGLFGTLPVREGDCFYNRGIYINKGRIEGTYDKVRLFGWEKEDLCPGKVPVGIFKYKHINFASQICMDILNPVPLFEMTKKQDISLLLISGAVKSNYLFDLAKARTFENQLIAIFANRNQDPKQHPQYSGTSAIYYPTGFDNRCGVSEQKLIIVSVKEKELQHARDMRKFLQL